VFGFPKLAKKCGAISRELRVAKSTVIYWTKEAKAPFKKPGEAVKLERSNRSKRQRSRRSKRKRPSEARSAKRSRSQPAERRGEV